MLQCTYSGGCLKKFKTKEAMKEHQRVSHKMIRCTGCLKSFQSTEAMHAHRSVSHASTRLIIACDYAGCPVKFQSESAMRQHSNTSHGMQCKHGCSKRFQDGTAMGQHVSTAHGQPPSAPATRKHRTSPPSPKTTIRPSVAACMDCGKEFSTIEGLRNHQMTQPGHIRPAKRVGSLECEACNRTLRDQAALERHFAVDHSVVKLPRGFERDRLERRFKEQWLKPTKCGKVVDVFKVYNDVWRTRKFEGYRASLKNCAGGNEVERYHGTTLICDLGIAQKNSKLCENNACNLCSILRTGFKTAKARRGWQRFGPGIYTTATSGKSNDYINCLDTNRRAVLVCRVLAGKVYRTQENMPHLQCPPEGMDSVSGEVGKDLNYDETVVYTSKAILPGHLIVYEMPQ